MKQCSANWRRKISQLQFIPEVFKRPLLWRPVCVSGKIERIVFYRWKLGLHNFLMVEYLSVKDFVTSTIFTNAFLIKYFPRKDERVSLPWSHQVVSNSRPLDWESSTLTNRTLLHKTLCLLLLMKSFNGSLNHPITLVWCSLEPKPWQQTFSKAFKIPRNTPQTSGKFRYTEYKKYSSNSSNTLLILCLIEKSS